MTDTRVYPRVYEEPREAFVGKYDFLATTICCIVGTTSVYKFPYVAYKNGGGAFFIPYICCVVCVGMPMFLLETALGQFSNRGPLTAWTFCPLATGCGLAMVITMGVSVVVYNITLAWGIYFFFASLSSPQPWEKCGHWSSENCVDTIIVLGKVGCLSQNGTLLNNGVCDLVNETTQIYLWSQKNFLASGFTVQDPGIEYFFRHVLGRLTPEDAFSFSSFSVPLIFCHLLGCLLVLLFIIRGIRVLPKIAMVTSTCSFVMLCILLVRGLALDNAQEGVLFYLVPDVSALANVQIWSSALFQNVFSLSTSIGTIIGLASYNKFHYNFVKVSYLVPLIDCLVSMLVGLLLLIYIVFVGNTKRKDISVVFNLGSTLLFAIMPLVFSTVSTNRFWSAIYFFLIVTVGIDSQFVYVEILATTVMDIKPALRKRRALVSCLLCLGIFLAGLPMTAPGGLDLLEHLIPHLEGLNLIMMSLGECIAIGWLYGADRFTNDITSMIGVDNTHNLISMWWKLSWKFLIPIVTVLMTPFILEKHYRSGNKPLWAVCLGWTFTFACFMCIVGSGVHRLCAGTGTLTERLKTSITPAPAWGQLRRETRKFSKGKAKELIAKLDEYVAVEVAAISDISTLANSMQPIRSSVNPPL